MEIRIFPPLPITLHSILSAYEPSIFLPSLPQPSIPGIPDLTQGKGPNEQDKTELSFSYSQAKTYYL